VAVDTTCQPHVVRILIQFGSLSQMQFYRVLSFYLVFSTKNSAAAVTLSTGANCWYASLRLLLSSQLPLKLLVRMLGV